MAKWIPSPNVLPGSTDIGSNQTDTHQFTGSVQITGSLAVNGVNITGSGGGGSGDVTGPGAATDNAIVRFDGTGGKTIQNSSVTIDDSNNVGGATSLSASDGISGGALTIENGATIKNTNGANINIGENTSDAGYYNISIGDTSVSIGDNQGSTSITIGDSSIGGASNTTFLYGQVTASNGFKVEGALDVTGDVSASSNISASAFYGAAGNLGTLTTTGNTTLGNSLTDSHQVSGTLHVSGGIMQHQYFSASISSSVNATCSLYNVFNYHLTANSEVTASNPVAGTSYLFFFRQDGTGTRTVDFSGFKWPGGTAPTLSTAGGAVDIVSGISDGTYIYADTTKAFS